MDLDEALDAIDAALDEGEIEAGLQLARQVVKEHPHESDAHLALGHALWDAGDLRGARDAYQKAVRLAPDAAETHGAVAWAQFSLAEFAPAAQAARRSNELLENADACALLGRIAERDGRLDEADRLARRAHALDPDAFPMPFRVTEAEFRAVVSEALDELPEEFQRALDGEVAVLVEPVPPAEVLGREEPPLDPELLGLYVGVPLPERQGSYAAPKLPDVIYLFHHNLEHEALDRQELLEQIAITVYHEVGHYFGFDDDQLDELDFG